MKKFYLQTYGCKLNQADSDIIRGLLRKEFKEASVDEADFVVINSCGVVKTTERRIVKRIKQLKKRDKKIILTGCLPLISSSVNKLVDVTLGPKEVLDVTELAKSVIGGVAFNPSIEKDIDKASLYKIKQRKGNSVTSVVPIAEGCMGDCTYCATKFARGRLHSFSSDNIIQEVNNLVEQGYKEIQLTSQDTGCYGLDRGDLELPSLLKKITDINGDFKVRVGMANPSFVRTMLADLISVFKSDKIYNFIHLPIQSGSNKILKLMKRGYKVEDCMKIIGQFKENFDDPLIAIDVIVGFPGETTGDFKKTVELIKDIRPHVVHINKFSTRPGISANNLRQVSVKEKSQRSKELTHLCDRVKLENNKQYLGKTYDVLVAKKGKYNTFISRPQSFRAIILKKVQLGQFRKAKVTNVEPNYLVGRVIE